MSFALMSGRYKHTCNEDAKGIQEVVVRNLPRFLVSGVESVHASDGFDSALIFGGMGGKPAPI